MVQFKCARVINPLVSFTFRVNCGVPREKGTPQLAPKVRQEKGNAASGF